MMATPARKSLVIGANGLIGQHIGKILTGQGIPWVGTCLKRKSGGLVELDITDHEQVAELMDDVKPDVVYHTANLAGGVDFCEAHPEEAKKFHFDATCEIGRLCNRFEATLVFLSTDYVFDGTSGPCREDDPKHPLNHYGRVKLKAEEWIRTHVAKHIIVRTTNVYGWDPMTLTPNYVMGLVLANQSHRQMNAPSFLWGTPTYVCDLAAALVELASKRASGTFHIVGGSFINRLEWARVACDVLGLDSSLIREIKEPSAASVPRPLKSWLSSDRFKRSFETRLSDVRDGILLMKEAMDSDKKHSTHSI